MPHLTATGRAGFVSLRVVIRLMLYIALCYRYINFIFPFKLFSYPLLCLFINILSTLILPLSFQFSFSFLFCATSKKTKKTKTLKKNVVFCFRFSARARTRVKQFL